MSYSFSNVSNLLALDIAILPPPDVRQRTVKLSAALPERESKGLRLDEEHLPHATLTQQFVRVSELDSIVERVDGVLRGTASLTLNVTGGGGGDDGSAVWMAIECTGALVRLHERLMEALREFERPGGGRDAFFGGDARVEDIAWVTAYRLKASLTAFTPHITLGHAKQPPQIEPFTFEATTVAACHLGRFCTCRRVLKNWTLR